jgi:class 3 adenylate cyclase/tetratricopeptide (TPR) repeat protein
MKVCPSCGEENPARFRLCGFCGAELAPAARVPETRKTVSIVFSDLKGSTNLGEKLDPESVRELMSRYFERMKGVLERHGGSVEKYIGDAIMAVFGLPVVREDDALRAVRAAAEMRRSLERLNDELERGWGVRLFQRTGVNTGEVVAGDPSAGQRLVVGDAVNVAARLEQAANDMEILLGDLTYRLVRHLVEVKQVTAPVELKGKADPVSAYRLLAVRGDDGSGGRPDTAMVGRDSELGVLASELARAVEEGACRMVTVLGEPGVGKSRLAREFAAEVGGEALVLRGRCLPYGRGITFWPLVEAVREAASIDDYDTAELARDKIATAAAQDEEVTARVAAAVGLSSAQFPVSELMWGARRLFETLAATRPLALVVEDAHWAETTFLDLVEHVVESARSAPILVVCLARHELLEIRDGWGQATGSALVRLQALSEADAGLVVDNLLGAVGIADEARSRIVEAADGNPLFVEQLLSMLIDDGQLRRDNGRWLPAGDLASIAVPPSLDALLAARLDGLPSPERTVLEAASVIGQIFQQEAVEELVEEEGELVGDSLDGLVRKQLVRPDPGAFASERGFRFQHILVRDAAYRGLLKRARATLHQRFVDWADRVNRERVREAEYEEILGYHLEQAYRYLGELGPLDEQARQIGARAAERLGSTGRRAFARGDMPAAANLLRRAAGVLPADHPGRLALLPELGEALMEIGEFAWAEVFLDEAVDKAGAQGNAPLAAEAALMRLLVRSNYAEGWSEDELVREAERAIPVFEQAGYQGGLAEASRLLAWAHGTAGRYGAAASAAEQAIEHARLAGDRRQQARAATQYAVAALYGPTPVAEAMSHCQEFVAQVDGDRRAEGLLLSLLARLEAMQGDFERARELYVEARQTLEELGRSVVASSTSLDSCGVEMLAGDPAAAERELRRDYESLDEMGEKYLLSTVAGELCRALTAQDRYAEAEEFARIAEETAAEDDVTSQALWRSGRAKVLARRGEFETAVALAHEAVERMRRTDAWVIEGDALVDLADVLRAAGRAGEARTALEEALDLFERKGNVAAAESTARALAAV